MKSNAGKEAIDRIGQKLTMMFIEYEKTCRKQ